MLDMDKMVVITAAVFCGFLAYGMLQQERRGMPCTKDHAKDFGRFLVEDRNKRHYPYATYITVEGMGCRKCALRVENALNVLPDTWATARLREGRVLVRTKKPFQEEAIRQAVEEAGYTYAGSQPQ